MSEYSDDDLVRIVAHGIRTGDTRAVEAALRVLAVQNPQRAQDTLDTIRLGLSLSGAA